MPSDLPIDIQNRDGAVIVQPSGEVDLARSPVLRSTLSSVIADDPSRLVLDLSKVVAFTQGAAPGAADPNRLSSFKPGSLPRKQYDADRHGGIGRDRHVLPGEEAVSR